MTDDRTDAEVLADPLVVRAREYARRVHAGDVRKGSGTSYFDGHLEPVARIVAADGGDAVQVAAAYLHDTAEDHGGQARLDALRASFGDAVADIVADLSDSLVDTAAGEVKQPWRPRKEAHLRALAAAPATSLAVGAADKLHNLTSILEDHAELGDDLWSRFTTGDAGDQRWYYEQVGRVLGERLPGHPTVRRLQAAVDELRVRLGGR